MKRKIYLSVAEFAISSPREGSIDHYSGFGNDHLNGQKIHLEIQQERKSQHLHYYESEVKITHSFVSKKNIYKINGRMDGVFYNNQFKIEEIKTSFNIFELAKYIKKNIHCHPYILQLRTYGYLHWLQTKEIPILTLHLVSTRKKETVDIVIDLDIEGYEKWLNCRIEELDKDIAYAAKIIRRRKKAAKNIKFPFATQRAGQRELIETIEHNIHHKKHMLIQAPTGLGKTIGVLYPFLKESLTRGQKVIYVTPKNSQHAIAEEAINKLRNKKFPLKYLTLTAKQKMCLKSEPICNANYCEFAKDHYTKVSSNHLVKIIERKKDLTENFFKDLGREFKVCPFELQFEAVKKVDTIICDYNYVFSPRSGLGRVEANLMGEKSKGNLIIDEIHNLPARSMDYFSSSLSTVLFEHTLKNITQIQNAFRGRAQELLHQCIAILEACKDNQALLPCKIEPPLSIFTKQDNSLREFIGTYLNSTVTIFENDLILKFIFYWSEFTKTLEFISQDKKEFFTTLHINPTTIKITCCDASKLIQPAFDNYQHIIGFSATLKPFDFYSQLTGLQSTKLDIKEFTSPFPKKNRKIIVIPQVSTKLFERHKSYSRIAVIVDKIITLKKGNYLVFFPSFDFLEKTAFIFFPSKDFLLIKQYKGMTKYDVEDILKKLKDESKAHIIFAVQGGIFSEGIDYPENMAIGAFIIGPPLPTFDFEQEQKRLYYQKQYSAGFEYAYTYPAMAKAIQSAGRVIRSETDKGIIVLIDSRFTEKHYTECMPSDWFETDHTELLSQSILNDISEFWRSNQV